MKRKKTNNSEERKSYLRKIRNDKITTHIFRVLLLVIIVGLWELLTAVGILDAFFISSPSRIVNQLVEFFKTGEMWHHIGITLYEALAGFIIATVIGTFIAIVLWWSEKLRKVLDPYIVVLNALPKIALGPVIIIWVGAGTPAIITMCMLICVIITTLSMLSSFMSCEKEKISLMKSMGATKFQILKKLVLPNSFGEFISVLKINVGMSWVGTIMGEYLVSKAGLGYLIVYGGQVFNLDLVMASTVILCVLASMMYIFVSILEKKFKS